MTTEMPHATATQLDLSGLPEVVVEEVNRIVREARSRPAPVDPAPSPAHSAEEWVARWKAWAAGRPSRTLAVDDSRESIYEGCGE